MKTNPITTTQAAQRLRVSIRRVMALIYEGKLAGAYKLCNLWQIPADAVESRLKAKQLREGI